MSSKETATPSWQGRQRASKQGQPSRRCVSAVSELLRLLLLLKNKPSRQSSRSAHPSLAKEEKSRGGILRSVAQRRATSMPL